MTAFFDIDTQNDFMLPSGALYVPGAEQLIPAIQRLNQAAPVLVSTMDAHREDDEEFRVWPPHCVAGCFGQMKPAATLLDRRVTVSTGYGLPDIGGARQILLEKQKLDLFTNPNLPALLEKLNATEFVVYGVVTEYCVRCAAVGLAKLGKPVHVVTDAIRALDTRAADMMFAEVRTLGGSFTSASEVCARVNR